MFLATCSKLNPSILFLNMPEKPLKLPHAVIRPAFTGIFFEKSSKSGFWGSWSCIHSPQKWSRQINLSARSYSNSLNVYAF